MLVVTVVVLVEITTLHHPTSACAVTKIHLGYLTLFTVELQIMSTAFSLRPVAGYNQIAVSGMNYIEGNADISRPNDTCSTTRLKEVCIS